MIRISTAPGSMQAVPHSDSPGGGPPAIRARSGGRREFLVVIPFVHLPTPGPDPSIRLADHSAEVEGYALTPEGITIVLAIRGPRAVALSEEVWRGLDAQGRAVRRRPSPLPSDLSTVVGVLRPVLSPATLGMVCASLLMPVHLDLEGNAELRLVLTPEELARVEAGMRAEGRAPLLVRELGEPDPEADGSLTLDDWAFLGLLSALHVFDGPEPLDAASAATQLGMELPLLEAKVRTVESGMRDLVAGIFAPPSGEAELGVPG